MEARNTLAQALRWLNEACSAADPTQQLKAAADALSCLRTLARERDPLVLSCSDGHLFLQGRDVEVDAGVAAAFARALLLAGIVSVLFHSRPGLAYLMLLLAVLRGDPEARGALDNPSGPLGEGRGIRTFAAGAAKPAVPSRAAPH